MTSHLGSQLPSAPAETDADETGAVWFAALHALRVKGLAATPVVAAISGLPEQLCEQVLGDVVEAGLAVRREGRMPGTMLTAAGRERYLELTAVHTLSAAQRARIEHEYDAFLVLNDQLKAICSAWQLLPDGTPNDHADPGYDADVVADLSELDARAIPVLRALASSLPRFGGYEPRFGSALERVKAGEAAAFARPMADSYHDVWMELHQDLLLTLGRERSAADGH